MFVIGIGIAESKPAVALPIHMIALTYCDGIVILMIRTWAVWGMDRRLTIGLPIFFVSIWLPLSVYAVRSVTSLTGELQDFVFKHFSKLMKIKSCKCRFHLSKAALFQEPPLHPKNGL